MDCSECLSVFGSIGSAFNSGIETSVFLERVAEAVTRQLHLKGCVVRLLTRDRKVLEDVASYGLSSRFLDKGPVDAERSMAAALAGEVVMIEDCTTDPRIQYPEAHEVEGIVSCLTVPLETRGQIIGTLRLFSSEPRHFGPTELTIVRTVASFTTRAITHCMFHRVLDRVTDAVRTTLDRKRVAQGIVDVVSEELRAKGASLHLVEGSGRRLALEAQSGLGDHFVATTLDPMVAAVWPRLDRLCEQIFEPGDGGIVPNPQALEREGIASQLFVPLVARDRSLGVLGVYTNSPYHFSGDELYFMRAVGAQCAFALENARMYAALEERYQTLAGDFQSWFQRPTTQLPT